ncbi:MAG TPA: molybdopterin-binding protein [Xanthobacteraceae bacterium]|nr:molybdopterin-binding protein [Xanthobacteraceae bacterium]
MIPLAEALAIVDASTRPVAARNADLAAACGRTLAADVIVTGPQPEAALALRDGWAVRSQDTADAGSYAPAPLSGALRIAAGEPMPAGTDAVAPEETVLCRGELAESVAPIAPGDGVLLRAADAQAGHKLCLMGRRLRLIDQAVLRAVGIRQVGIREPRLRLVRGGRGGEVIAAAYEWLGRTLANEGAAVRHNVGAAPGQSLAADQLAAAFRDETSDAIFVVGGTGTGSTDMSVAALATFGQVKFHGVALLPGQTAAFGLAGTKPVLLFPGRLDAALAVWLTLGRRLLERIAGSQMDEAVSMAELSRKIASPLGMAEIVPVRRRGNSAEPLAGGYLSLSSLAAADGWIFIPDHSEGWPAGTQVAVRPLA